ncbi:MAG: 6-bladed beta-propeller [Candidatus Aegiribacteria sp.]|nr:6-bladed beta-propeller [Candidatus Aegiribacteria sp.]
MEGLTILEDGSIVLLDRAFSRVMVYSRDGIFQRQIGRAGDGPGEMSQTVFMTITENGNLLVSQRDAMERFDFNTGEWIAEYPRGMTPPPFVLAGMRDSSFVAVHFQMMPRDDRLMADVTLGIYLPGDNEPDVVLAEQSFEFTPTNAAPLFENVFDAYSVAEVDYETVYFASRSSTEYEVLGYNTSGEQVFELVRNDFEPVEMTPVELEEETEFMEARLVSLGAGDQSCSPDPFYPMISGLGIDDYGNIWVRRGIEQIPTFDVYDNSGELLRIVTLPVEPSEGKYWNVIIQSAGVLAYSENPARGYQKVYMLETL